MSESEHLGDGVYVKSDGYALAISVNDHRAEPVVFIEPAVLMALIRFATKEHLIKDILG